MNLARDMIGRTRISKLLAGYRNRSPVDIDQLCLTLMRVSQMIIDIPEILELDINTLWSDEKGGLAVDARIRISPYEAGTRRLAIRPYPQQLEEHFQMRSGRQVLLRPIRPEDEPKHHEFLAKLTPRDIRFRFFGSIRKLSRSGMARLTRIDYDREMAFIAVGQDENGKQEKLGVVRTVTDTNNHTAEYAVVVRSDLKGDKPIGGMIATENKSKQAPESLWLLSLSEQDVDRAAALTGERGGKVVEGPLNADKRGQMALVNDPAGAPLILLRSVGGDPADTEASKRLMLTD
jgi:predicted enzyme related to lactoylglutathione lyase